MRNSTAAYYDGQTTAMAEQNLLKYSQDLSQTSWSGTSGIYTANTTAAPDGTTTSGTLTGTNTSNYRQQDTGITVSGSLVYTYSSYFKAGTVTSVILYMYGNNISQAVFDLTGVTATPSGVGTPSATITSVGNGWYRCTLTAFPSGGLSLKTVVYTGIGDYYLWGAQLEQRSSVTAYTPTTTSAITNYIPVLMTAPAGVARFDCDPITGKSLGLLIEESRTNLLTYSSAFSNGVWNKNTSSITANNTIAPDGTLTGSLLRGISSGERIYQVVNAVQSTSITGSVYCQVPSTGVFAGVTLFIYNLTTATSLSYKQFNGNTFSSINGGISTTVGNGWYRLSGTWSTGISINDNIVFYIYPDSTVGSTSGNVLNIWGAQLEAGSFATSYTATLASTVTRAADQASMTGSNFSSWYNQSQGSLYWEGDVAIIPAPAAIVLVGFDNSTAKRVMYVIGGGSVVASYDGISTVSSGLNIGINTIFKSILTYSQNTRVICVSAGTPISGVTTPAFSASTILNIGGAAPYPLNGHIRKLSYYPVALSSNNLVALTS